MRKIRKIASVFLVFALVFGMIPTAVGGTEIVKAEELPAELPNTLELGKCGENITCTLTKDEGVEWDLEQGKPYQLTLTGTGDIPDYTFYDSNTAPWYAYRGMITSVSIGEGITSIGEYAFYGCASLKEIVFPASVEKIGKSAFYQCSFLEKVTCGSGLKEIGEQAFYNLPSLKQVQLNDGLESIGISAFSTCWELKEIAIPDTVKVLKEGCFGSTGLVTFTVPKGVTEIKDSILVGASNLEEIQVAPENANFQVIDGVLYSIKEGKLNRVLAVAYDKFQSGSALKIAEGAESIGANAFSQARMSAVQLPSSLKEIGSYAFTYCPHLSGVNIPDGVEKVGVQAFGYCSSLKAVSFGKGVNKLGGPVFYQSNKLETITVNSENQFLEAVENVLYSKDHTILYTYAPAKPEKEYHILDTVTEISTWGISGASYLEELYLPETISELKISVIIKNTKLKSIYFPGDAPTYGWDSITENAANLIIYRPPASVGWDAEAWKAFQLADWEPENNSQEEGEFDGISWKYEGDKGRIIFVGTGEMPDFSQDEPSPWSGYIGEIQTVESKGIAGIGDYAFSGGGKLLRLEADAPLQRIGDYAFSDCGALVFCGFASAEVIGAGAFQNDVAMKGRLTLEKVSSIGSGAFSGCGSLTNATLGNKLAVLDEEVFAGCSGMADCILPETVSEIRRGAFRDCTSLRAINIPGTVHILGAQAFAGDSALERVYFYGPVPREWAPDSFADSGSGLTLCYRKSQAAWDGLGGAWNSLPLLGLDRFYTERQDHYSFTNSADSFGYSNGYRIPRQRFVDVLDSIVSGTYYYAINKKWLGSCYGMAGTTLEFYENPQQFPISQYGGSAGNLYQIAAPGSKDAPLTKLIEAYQISQYKTSLAGCSGLFSRNLKDYEGLVHKVEAFERSGGLRADSKAEPLVLAVYSDFRGHALIPVSVEQTENGDFQIKVYDCNKPAALQTLIVKKDFSGISYEGYYYASYLEYSEVAAAMSGIELHNMEGDNSLYLSIDKEFGTVNNQEGKAPDEIEGAYEQKPFGAEEDVFSGIRSFVLPKGDYQVTADVPEGEAETASPDSVTFYLATEDYFAEITSPDENADLQVKAGESQDSGLVLELESDSGEGEAAAFTVVNSQGMERTVETAGSNAVVSLGENNQISIEAPGQETVSLDGQQVALQDGKMESSFLAGERENPLKAVSLEAEASCDGENNLSGTATAEVVLNDAADKAVTLTVEFFEKDGAPAAVYSEKKTLSPGRSQISLSFENLKTAFQKTEGDAALSCKLTVTDEGGNSVFCTKEGIQVTLTNQGKPDSGDGTDTKPGDGTDTKPGDGTSTKPGTENGNNTKPKPPVNNNEKPDSDDSEDSKPSVPNKNEKKCAVTSVKASVKKLTLGIGETYALKASVQPANASDKKLKFTASNNRVTVSAKGKITAKKAGSSKVIIESSNGKKALVQISVKKKPAKIELNAKRKTIRVGWKFQIRAKFPKGTVSNKLTYSSSKKSVASVSSTGKITAKKKGTAIITVKTYNGKKARMKITVVK